MSTLLSCLLLLLAWLFAPKRTDLAKLSAYECGFDPFDSKRNPFDIHFFIVALIFLIFDLEIIYLLPWVLSVYFLSKGAFLLSLFFFILITVGVFHEWKAGILEWGQSNQLLE